MNFLKVSPTRTRSWTRSQSTTKGNLPPRCFCNNHSAQPACKVQPSGWLFQRHPNKPLVLYLPRYPRCRTQSHPSCDRAPCSSRRGTCRQTKAAPRQTRVQNGVDDGESVCARRARVPSINTCTGRKADRRTLGKGGARRACAHKRAPQVPWGEEGNARAQIARFTSVWRSCLQLFLPEAFCSRW